MTKQIQLTILSTLLTFCVFGQDFHFEITTIRTKEAMKKYSSHPTIYKIDSSDVSTVIYDTVEIENPRYGELASAIKKKKESLIKAKSNYNKNNKEQSFKNEIFENINAFKAQSGSFKKKKQFLIDAQSFADSLGLKWFIYPKTFGEKISYKQMRLEGTLSKHLTQYTNELFRHVGESRPFDDTYIKRKISEYERQLSTTPKMIKKLKQSEKTGKRSALVVTGKIDDISTINGRFHYVNYDEIVVFVEAFDEYAQNEVVYKNGIRGLDFKKYITSYGVLMVNDETGEQYLTPSSFLSDYGVDTFITNIENDIKGFGYKLVNIEGDMYIDTGKRKLFLTKDIYDNLSKSYIDAVGNSVNEFVRLKPQIVALTEKLQNHYLAFRNLNMTTNRRAIWKSDCQKGIDKLKKIDAFKGRQGDAYLEFSKHFKGSDAHTKFVDFQLVVMNTKKKLGM